MKEQTKAGMMQGAKFALRMGLVAVGGILLALLAAWLDK